MGSSDRLRRLREADLSGGVGLAVERYVHIWQAAVRNQADRLKATETPTVHAQADLFLFVMSLHQLHLAAEFAEARTDDPQLRQHISEYEAHFEGRLRLARHSVEHFDEWRAGKGRSQPKASDGSWISFPAIKRDARGDDVQVDAFIRLGPGELLQVNVDDALEGADRLATAAQNAVDRFVSEQSSDSP